MKILVAAVLCLLLMGCGRSADGFGDITKGSSEVGTVLEVNSDPFPLPFPDDAVLFARQLNVYYFRIPKARMQEMIEYYDKELRKVVAGPVEVDTYEDEFKEHWSAHAQFNEQKRLYVEVLWDGLAYTDKAQIVLALAFNEDSRFFDRDS